MHMDYILILVVMVTLLCVCRTDSDKFLTEFEKRIGDLKTLFNKTTEDSEGLTNDKDYQIDDNEERHVYKGEYPENINNMIESLKDKSERCCILGKILSEFGLRCNDFRFSKAIQRTKPRLVNETLVQLGIQVNQHNRHLIYIPFRKCAVRNPREIDKCCLVHGNERTGYNEMNLGIHSKRGPGKHRRHSIKHQHHSIESAKRGFQTVRQSRDKTRRSQLLDKSNYQWERWADYREMRSRHRNHKSSSRYRSYRHRRRHKSN